MIQIPYYYVIFMYYRYLIHAFLYVNNVCLGFRYKMM